MKTASLDVMAALKPIGALYAAENYDRALSELEQLWNSLPLDQTSVPNAYLLVEYAAELSLKIKAFGRARFWAERGLAFRERRHDLGEAEFLLAKVAYEQGEFKEARDFLRTAVGKSDGKILVGENPKYSRLLEGGDA